MNRVARSIAVAPLVVALGWLGVCALEAGAAGSQVFDAGVALRVWSESRVRQPAPQALAGMREGLLRAQEITPRDPAVHELLGLIEARRGENQEYLPQAAVQLVKAIELRPTSPQTWASLAAVKYRMGDTGPAFEAAINHAVELGKLEPEVQGIIANYGLAVWNEVAPATRASIESTVAAGMKRNSLEMLQFGERRGRLDVPCRHLAGSSRQTDPKWSQLCQSMEATS
jgi:predicted Zn-dependent protease